MLTLATVLFFLLIKCLCQIKLKTNPGKKNHSIKASVNQNVSIERGLHYYEKLLSGMFNLCFILKDVASVSGNVSTTLCYK